MNLTRMKNKLLICLTVCMFALAGCTTKQAEQDDSTISRTNKNEDKVITQEYNYQYIAKAGFSVRDEKIIKQSEKADEKNTVQWYLDPYCSACVKLEGIISPRLAEITSKMTIDYNIMGFLASRTVDEYSLKASSYILSVVETTPEIGFKYFEAIISDSFAPEDGTVETKEDKFREVFISLGGTEEQWKEVLLLKEKVAEDVRIATAEAFNSDELLKKAKSKKLTVPFIIIGNSEYALDFSEAVDAEDFIMTSFQEYIDNTLTEKNK